jgi:ketosteroid isomerase-like protein
MATPSHVCQSGKEPIAADDPVVKQHGKPETGRMTREGPVMSSAARGEDDRVEIQKATAELLSAVNSSDDRRLLAIWSDDGVLMPPNHAVVRGRAELEQYFKERFSGTRFRLAFTFSDIQLAGDLAFERLAYTAVIWPAGGAKPVDDAGKGLHVYRRQPDGLWKLALDIWNSDGPAAPQTSAAPDLG